MTSDIIALAREAEALRALVTAMGMAEAADDPAEQLAMRMVAFALAKRCNQCGSNLPLNEEPDAGPPVTGNPSLN